MSGAYVAKPPTTVTPSYPPGWNIYWPFPGANPPGYTPVYTLGLTSAALVVVSNPTGAATALVKDHASFQTTQPTSQLTWTASINGAPINLGTSPSSLAATLNTDYEQVSTFWGDALSLYFDIDNDDIGKEIVLSVSSSPFGGLLVDTSNITVSGTIPEDEPGITVYPNSKLKVTASGGTDSFVVRLNSSPLSSVNIDITATEPDEVSISPSSVSFTALNYNNEQEVTLTGQDAGGTEPVVNFNIEFSVSSSDGDYNGFEVSPVDATNTYCTETTEDEITLLEATPEVYRTATNGPCLNGMFCEPSPVVCALDETPDPLPSVSAKGLVEGMQLSPSTCCGGSWSLILREGLDGEIEDTVLKQGTINTDGVAVWSGSDITLGSKFYDGEEETACTCEYDCCLPEWPFWCGYNHHAVTVVVSSTPATGKTETIILAYSYTNE